MKKLILTCCLLTTSALLYAQSAPGHDHFKNHVRRSLARQQAAAFKTTVMKQRLTGTATNTMGSLLVDTSSLVYTGTKGSQFDLNFMEYRLEYPPALERKDYPYDWSSVALKADTVLSMGISQDSTQLNLEAVKFISYNNNEKVASYTVHYFTDNLPDGADRYLNSFDANGLLQITLHLVQNGIAWDTSERFAYYYNSQGQLVTDTIFAYQAGSWLPQAAVNYTYNSAGDILTLSYEYNPGASWFTLYSYEHEYYPGNMLKLITARNIDLISMQLALTQKDSFGYHPGSQFTTSNTLYLYDNGTWVPASMFSKTVNAQGLPDSVHYYSWDLVNALWVRDSLKTFYYNGYDNPDFSQLYLSPGGTSPVLATSTLYYYDIYNAPDRVNTTMPPVPLWIYPNPVNRHLAIRHVDAGSGSAIRVADIAGKVVMEMKRPAEQLSYLDTSKLSPGTYSIRVSYNGSGSTATATFLKQ